MKTAVARILLGCCTYLSLVAGTALAQFPEPTPETPLGNLKKSGVVPLASKGYDALVKLEQSLNENLKKALKDPTPGKDDIQKTYFQIAQFNRWTSYLEPYREPATRDWRERYRIYYKTFHEVRDRFFRTPAAAKSRADVLKQLSNSQANRLKTLGQIEKGFDPKDPRKTEAAIDKVRNDVFSISGVLLDDDKKPFYDPIVAVDTKITSIMLEYRMREAASVQEAEQNKLNELNQVLKQAVEEASTPDALQKVVDHWRASHLQRLRLLHFASATGTPFSAMKGAPGQMDADLGNPIMEQVKAGIVESVKRQAASPNAGQAYMSLQRVLAELSLLAEDAQWSDTLQTNLTLVAKAAQLSFDEVQYRSATEDLLRWRQRAATEWANASSIEPASSVARRELTTKQDFIGLYANDRVRMISWNKAIPEMFPMVSDKLIGKQIRTAKVVPTTGGQQEAWLSRMDDGLMFSISANPVNKVVTPILQRELLCEKMPPLSLKVAIALLSAEMGICEQVGGEIKDLAIESHMSRMTNLPDGQSTLVPLGTLGQPLELDSRWILVVRSKLEPKWFQHQYLMVNNN